MKAQKSKSHYKSSAKSTDISGSLPRSLRFPSFMVQGPLVSSLGETVAVSTFTPLQHGEGRNLLPECKRLALPYRAPAHRWLGGMVPGCYYIKLYYFKIDDLFYWNTKGKHQKSLNFDKKRISKIFNFDTFWPKTMAIAHPKWPILEKTFFENFPNLMLFYNKAWPMSTKMSKKGPLSTKKLMIFDRKS